jgi:arylformamidase
VSDWIDVTMPLAGGMPHWPGDPDVEIVLYESISAGAEYNATRIAMSAHTGTHIDAPLHYLPGAASMDAMPPALMTGLARVIAPEEVGGVEAGERVLLKTTGGALTPAQATELVRRSPALAGIDSLSIGGCGGECGEVHRILLSAGVWIVEGLVLSAVAPGRYEFLCLPLRLTGADGAPTRALLRRL